MAGKVKDVAALACLLLMLLSFCANCVSSKPTADTAAVEEAVDSLVHSVAKRQSDYRDSRWRMMTALTVLNELSRMMVRCQLRTLYMYVQLYMASYMHTYYDCLYTSVQQTCLYDIVLAIELVDSRYKNSCKHAVKF